MDRITRVCNAAKKAIVPTPQMRIAVESRAETVRRAVERRFERAKIPAEVRLDGSVAKDTWIRGYQEADIFVRVSPKLTKKDLRDRCLPIAKRALKPNRIIERFAEHPYIESIVKSKAGPLRINVVPCYNVERGNWLSATDRSPYHTEYIRSRLSEQQHDEVRLLKAFLRSIGTYGADIKTGGFSGMLCETLIVAFNDFQSVIRDFAEWDESRFTDVEGYWNGRGEEVHKAFREPLIVIDPVDKGRNLGAAVRPNQLWNFVAASRYFMERPSTSLFREPQVRPLTEREFRNAIQKRGSTILCLVMERIDAVVDILWSQLYRTERALVHLLESNDFEMVKSAAWSDEAAMNVLLFEIETGQLPQSWKHIGPPISRSRESAAFVYKHSKDAGTVSGPWIENERWVAQKRRLYTSARELLRSELRSGGLKVGVASLMALSLKKKVQIVENDQISGLISRNEGFARFLRTYLSRRPTWLG